MSALSDTNMTFPVGNGAELRPIVVSGSHKSGSTWVGKMLSLHRTVGYIHEPFSPLRRPGISNSVFSRWFTYVNSANEAEYIKALADAFHFTCNIRESLGSLSHPYHFVRSINNVLLTYGHKVKGSRPLVKDPIALFSLEWLSSSFNTETVVLIRHPAAFVNSVISAGWNLPFDDIYAQTELLEGPLRYFAEDIEEYASIEKSSLDKAILFWNIAHKRIYDYQMAHLDWIYIRHEDLLLDPVTQFKALYKRLGIPFESYFKAVINADSGKRHSVTAARFFRMGNAYIRRDSSSLYKSWTKHLDSFEISRIRSRTERFWPLFYNDVDW
jgi:hypothetical protein